MGVVWAEFVTTSIILVWLPHQGNKAVEGMGAAMLKGSVENTDTMFIVLDYLIFL